MKIFILGMKFSCVVVVNKISVFSFQYLTVVKISVCLSRNFNMKIM
jgi:hypothetical protein